jgi:uncharacterized membrane protein
MISLPEIIVFLAPIAVFLLTALIVFWQIALTAQGKVRFSTVVSSLIWVFLSFLFSIFTLSYLSPHVSGRSDYFQGLLIYAAIGAGLILFSRAGKES